MNTLKALCCLILGATPLAASFAQTNSSSAVISSPPQQLQKSSTGTVDSTLAVNSLAAATSDSMLTLNRPTSTDPNGTSNVSSSPSGTPVTTPSTVYKWQLIASQVYGGFGGMGQQYYTCDWTPPSFSQIGNNFDPGSCTSTKVGTRYYCSTFVPQSNDNLQDDTYECQAQ